MKIPVWLLVVNLVPTIPLSLFLAYLAYKAAYQWINQRRITNSMASIYRMRRGFLESNLHFRKRIFSRIMEIDKPMELDKQCLGRKT